MSTSSDRPRDTYDARAADGPYASDVDRQHAEYGGMKFGADFFGWLTAMGVTLLLTALLAATGTAIGLGLGVDTQEVTSGEASTVGIIGAILLLIVMFVGYFAGGYVAGRMARFDGLKQGLGVWLWAIIIAILVAVLGLIAGTQYDLFVQLNAFPRIPLSEGELTWGSVITAIVLALASLGGALLGGVAGVRYHRKVDRAGYAEPRAI